MTTPIANADKPLDAFTIALMYWENEKYMWPTTEWHLHEPRKEDYEDHREPSEELKDE